MPPVEAWKKVFVDKDKFLADKHNALGCVACHGGVGGVMDQAAAHQGLKTDALTPDACGTCHADVSQAHEGSLHQTLKGYETVLRQRASEETWPTVETVMENHCNRCHATCGDCHVSRPKAAEGGLLDGHAFKKTPPMNLTCTGCHGSRVNDEYKGRNKDADGKRIKADVHFNPKGMTCTGCHTGQEMHGEGELAAATHRYDGPQEPSCTQEGCHDIQPGSNAQHTETHLANLSCQVCHSVQYKSCYSCHVQLSDAGKPFFKTEPSGMTFRIGLNPIKSDARPYMYVPLRHVPSDRNMFEFYGEDLLPNFDSRPTWAYATPHNIQRNTPQNASCDACHGNKDLFLTKDVVRAEEREANRDVIVKDVPKMPGS